MVICAGAKNRVIPCLVASILFFNTATVFGQGTQQDPVRQVDERTEKFELAALTVGPRDSSPRLMRCFPYVCLPCLAPHLRRMWLAANQLWWMRTA